MVARLIVGHLATIINEAEDRVLRALQASMPLAATGKIDKQQPRCLRERRHRRTAGRSLAARDAGRRLRRGQRPTFQPHGIVPAARRRHITLSFRSYIPGIRSRAGVGVAAKCM